MQTPYSRSFFALQIAFAQRVAKRFSLCLPEALWQCTSLPRESLHNADDWTHFAALIVSADDPLDVTYRYYLEHADPLPQPDDTTFFGYPLFGCFYVGLSDDGVVRTHYLNNDLPGMRPLSRERLPARLADLRRLFTYVREVAPDATTVRGNSWLYNLPAYRRLFPPSYTEHMVDNTDAAMHMIGLWAQCYDRFWEVKPEVASIVMERVEQAPNIASLRFCFPYQRLRTSAPIGDFYAFYGIVG